MGACVFVNPVQRKDAKSINEAFQKEVDRSRHESGHVYSGEIGMKREFSHARTAKKCVTLQEACDEADRLIENEDSRYGDKWGPAFYIEVEGEQGGWVFFGWAAS